MWWIRQICPYLTARLLLIVVLSGMGKALIAMHGLKMLQLSMDELCLLKRRSALKYEPCWERVFPQVAIQNVSHKWIVNWKWKYCCHGCDRSIQNARKSLRTVQKCYHDQIMREGAFFKLFNRHSLNHIRRSKTNVGTQSLQNLVILSNLWLREGRRQKTADSQNLDPSMGPLSIVRTQNLTHRISQLFQRIDTVEVIKCNF